MAAYPVTPDAVDEAWLSQVLGVAISELEVTGFGEGAGIIGQVTRATFSAEGEQRSAILKFPSNAAENRGVAMHYNMYGREVSFYRDFAQHIPVRVPACDFVGFDPQTHDFVLVLEDLQGYRLGDQVQGATLADAQAAVTAIARMHAATWQVDLPGLLSHNNPAQVDGMKAGFELGWPVVQERLAHLIPDAAAEKGHLLPGNVAALLDKMTAGPQSLVHADVRLDNLFFGTSESDPIALIDWQSVCSSCGEQDLAYFLTQSLPTQLLESDGESLINQYHQELLEQGVKDYSLDACRDRYRTSALYLMCYAVVISGTLDLGNERGAALGAALLGRSLKALDNLDAFALLT